MSALESSVSQAKTALAKKVKRQRFGRYETLFRIAAGGMAEVYAARIIGEGGFEKIVALKRMLPTLAEDKRFVDMFLDEGRVAANISSPNVVQTLDLGSADDGSLYLVMELVIGVSLSALVRSVLKAREFMDPAIAAELIAQAAMGLDDAHTATTPLGEPLELIHRDISPQNVLVDGSGQVRITDFGVAKAVQRQTRTQTGELKGKLSYFAPEQARGGDLTSRLDIFALGVVAWELIAGRRLFKADNAALVLQKVLRDPIQRVSETRQGVSDALADAIAKALERDPDHRWQTAREFATALRASVRPVSQREVGEYVRKYAADKIQPVRDGIQAALAMPDDDHELVLAGSRADGPISTSAMVPAGTASGALAASGPDVTGGHAAFSDPTSGQRSYEYEELTRARQQNQRLMWLLIALLTIAASVSAFLLIRNILDESPTPELAEPSESTMVVGEESQVDPPPEVADEILEEQNTPEEPETQGQVDEVAEGEEEPIEPEEEAIEPGETNVQRTNMRRRSPRRERSTVDTQQSPETSPMAEASAEMTTPMEARTTTPMEASGETSSMNGQTGILVDWNP